MGNRRHSRELILKFLYENELNPGDLEERLACFWARDLAKDNVKKFSERVIRVTIERREEIDSQLEKACQNWSLCRMAVVDRNILRMAACELIFFEMPARVIINEAVEIAKKYGGENSPDFINGILDRVKKETIDIVL